MGFLEFHDASHVSIPGLRSQSGTIHFVTDGTACEESRTMVGPCLWKTARVKRVFRSTFSAENLAAADVVDSAIHAQEVVSWTLFGAIIPRRMTDFCSLVQHLRNLAPKCVDKRIAIDKMAFREIISSKMISNILWRDTKVQLADCLTKLMTADRLYGTLAPGIVDLQNPGKLSNPKESDAGNELETKLAMFCLSIPGEEEFMDRYTGNEHLEYRC